MSDKPRESDLYGRNAYKRTINDTRLERDLGYGRLMDYNRGKRVEMWWDLSDAAKKKQLVKFRVGNEEVILNSEQLMKFLRWV